MGAYVKHILNIGDYAVTVGVADELVTYALGSCVALLFYCPRKKVAAMAHIALPATLKHSSSNNQRPGYYADEIVPRMIEELRSQYGCLPSQMSIHLIGGANSKSEKDPFQVGRRNVEVVSSILREYQLKFDATQVGGNVSRTVCFKNETGELEIRTQSMVL